MTRVPWGAMEEMGDDDMMDPGISRDDSEIGLPKSALPHARSVC